MTSKIKFTTFSELKKLVYTDDLLVKNPSVEPEGWMRLAEKKIIEVANDADSREMKAMHAKITLPPTTTTIMPLGLPLSDARVTFEVLSQHKKFSSNVPYYINLKRKIMKVLATVEELDVYLKEVERLNQSQYLPNSSSQSFNQPLQRVQSIPSLAPRVKAPLGQITPVELKDTLSKSSPRILIFDVRPSKEYFMGHVCWKSSKELLHSGVLNIEPEFLKAKLTCIELERSMSGLGLALFKERTKMELIIFCDGDSRTTSQSFEWLFDALYSGMGDEAPITLPKILIGGLKLY